jgi:hypothetical protein
MSYPIIIGALGLSTVADVIVARVVLALTMPPMPEVGKLWLVFQTEPPVSLLLSSTPKLPATAPYAVAAPSTGRAAPDTKEASSEIRNSAALAISSGLPVRPIGIWRARCTTSTSLS